MSVTPKASIAFKKLFGVDENKDLLISLINSIVSDEDQVEDVILLNPYNPSNFHKLPILNTKAKGYTGKLYNIEIQINNEIDYNKDASYYRDQLYAQQSKTSESHSRLNKTIKIHILSFTSITKSEKYHNVFRLSEEERKTHYFEDLVLHVIELDKFTINPLDQYLNETEKLKLLLPKIKTTLDKWIAFLTEDDLLRAKEFPKERKDANLAKALAVIEEMRLTEEEEEMYEGQLKWLRMMASTLERVKEKARAKEDMESKMKTAKLKDEMGLLQPARTVK